ncbi:MAG: hypothetical protein U1E76_16220 [Planctomycetota bacterium]
MNRRIIAYVVLAVLALAYKLATLPGGDHAPRAADPAPPGANATLLASSSLKEPPWLVQRSTAALVRDPFAPLVRAESQAPQPAAVAERPMPTFLLQGIVLGAGAPYALINGVVVELGDVLDGWRVADISAPGVAILAGGQRVLLDWNGAVRDDGGGRR